MAFDIQSIPPVRRSELITVGRQFSSHDTGNQADRHLLALAEHGPALAAHGFAAADVALLQELRALQIQAGVGRESARTDKKTTSTAYLQAMRQAKAVRLQARAVLEAVSDALGLSLDPGAPEALGAVRAVLAQTQASGADPERLGTQLQLLQAALARPMVAQFAAERGGPAVLTALSTAAAGLREALGARRTGGGTPVETETVDLVDGLIVALLRSARKAARSAARALGRPALALTFELEQLYASRGAKQAGAPADSVGDGGAAV